MTKRAKIIIPILIIAVLGVIGLVIYKNISVVFRDKAGNIVDQYGCIISADYSWCEAGQKCLRIGEEICDSDAQLEVRHILADKYQRVLSEVSVTVIRSDGSHAAGSVMFGEGRPGESGMFLAVKTDGKWEVVYDGNGSIDCNKMRQQYQFPDEILRPEFCD